MTPAAHQGFLSLAIHLSMNRSRHSARTVYLSSFLYPVKGPGTFSPHPDFALREPSLLAYSLFPLARISKISIRANPVKPSAKTFFLQPPNLRADTLNKPLTQSVKGLLVNFCKMQTRHEGRLCKSLDTVP